MYEYSEFWKRNSVCLFTENTRSLAVCLEDLQLTSKEDNPLTFKPKIPLASVYVYIMGKSICNQAQINFTKLL